MAQVILGELIRPRRGHGTAKARKRGFAPINSKRIDFAIIDRFGILVAAIKYQGSGHHQNGSFMRDAVKREALRKAGAEVLKINSDYNAEEVRMWLQSLFGAPVQ